METERFFLDSHTSLQTPDHHTFMTVFRTRPLTPDVCYGDVIDRLLSEQEFWGREALSDLLQANLVPSTCVGTLLVLRWPC